MNATTDDLRSDITSGKKVWTGGQLVVETLKRMGIGRMYGVPGGQTLAITDAILDEPGFTFVTTRHEGAAAVMADAAGRIQGVPGVCLATTGPGATNLLTGVGGALRDSSPVLVLTCNNRAPYIDRDDAQNADHVSIFRPLTKWATLVTDTASIPGVLQEAALRATLGNPGPVLVDLARDALEGSVELGPLEPVAPARVAAQRPVGDPRAVDRAAELIVSSRRPMLWIGNGVQISRAADAVLRLAEAYDLPVVTTFNAIGAVPSGHPHVFGSVTRMGTSLGHKVLREADLVVAVGNSMNAISTSRWAVRLPETLIQIDVAPEYLGRNYPGRTFGILGDARLTVEALHEALARGGAGSTDAGRRRLEALRETKAEWWRRAVDVDMAAAPMAPATAIKAVRDQAPDDTMLIVDAGNPGVWSYLWQVRTAGTYLKPVGFGNMGFGLPAAIAAKMINGERPLVALIGDGSLGMTLGELETVVREETAVCLVIMNDSSYGNIRQEQDHLFGEGRNIGVSFVESDYAMVAAAFGIPSYRANTGEELARAVGSILDSRRAGLVDARIDPEVSAWTFPLFSTDSEVMNTEE
ncbi:thiamine pyrophosphate-binding protein [Georgenia sp. AZ-5]|uniref:thiamine pyrophosphate-binding protein n=1 Tax=Georgenia sp. AZ-5 TaxID=3367526 RepID=UPI0037545BD2